jgi:site-specific recombinase XerD
METSNTIIVDNSYRNFIQSIKSANTKIDYARGLKYFLKFMKAAEYNDLLDKEPKLIQSDIIDDIIYLREQKKLAPASISAYVCAVNHFFFMNDIMLNWKKINSFEGEYYEVIEDQPYTHQQIRLMIDKAEQRNRALILLLCSSGIRVGAVPDLKIGDLLPIDKYSMYQITIYKKSKSKYITFCTPEARKEIDTHLQYRERCGEKLTKDSPLFRKSFDRSDLLQIRNNAKPLSVTGISWIIHQLLNTTGVRPTAKMTEDMTHNQRTNLMQCHGFRKFFDTTCTLAGMDGLYVEKLMGHGIGVKGHYFLPTPQELLEGNDKKLGYCSIIDSLTINEYCLLL